MNNLFKDDSGKTSSGRVLMMVVTVWYLVMMTKVCWATNTLPDFPLQAGGLITLLYGVNKFSPTIPFKEDKHVE